MANTKINQNKILIILTGGTICSTLNQNLKNKSNADVIKTYIVSDFKRSNSPYKNKVEFDYIKLTPDILSENMTINAWNSLLNIFKNQVKWQDYKGIILLHGTDTLAYTSSLLSLVLSGAPIPIFLVSAHLPLLKTLTYDKNGKTITKQTKQTKSNGFINFKVSVELILNGILPNVYVVYRNLTKTNKLGKTYIHLGSNLTQCKNYSNNFYSQSQVEIKDIKNAKNKGTLFETKTFYLDKIKTLTTGVLLINPYVGLDYSKYNLENVKAIVHNTYHSSTICSEDNFSSESLSNYSILSLLKRCKNKISVYLAPCDENSYAYESTQKALKSGALCIANTTLEMAFVKTLICYSLSEVDKTNFLKTSINHEFVYKNVE